MDDRMKARFFAKVEEVNNGCHEWQSTLHRDGYGKFWYGTGQIQAHRMAWIVRHGPVPDGLWVLHRCDNRKCVNPDHLYLGTAKDNIRDRNERCPWHGNMRISFKTIEEIRRRYAAGGVSQQKLADEFGMTQSQVSRYILKLQRIAR